MNDPIPTRAENPAGLHLKYLIRKANGAEVDPWFEGFVLRVDGGAEPNHREACLRALAAYAEAITPHIPQLAADLRRRYSLPAAAGFGELVRRCLALDGLSPASRAVEERDILRALAAAEAKA